MSVPKRFKTKTQKIQTRTVVKVFTKNNPMYLLDKYAIFVHPTKVKRLNHNNLNYLIKR